MSWKAPKADLFSAEASRLIRITAQQAAAAAAAESTRLVSEVLNTYVDNYSKAAHNRGSTMRKIYEEVGAAGQAAILREYDARHGKSRSYRQNDSGKWRRYSGGVLREALASPQMWKATAYGLNFINPRFLDERAKQWAKLNFGAAPATQRSHKVTPMEFFGKTIPGFDLEGVPGRAFSIPVGFFSSDVHERTPPGGVTADRGKRFYPLALMTDIGAPASDAKSLESKQNRRALRLWLKANEGSAKRMSRGIRGTRFLDAGVNEINRTLPPLVEKQVLTWLDEARKGVTSVRGKTIRVPGSGPLGKFQGMSPQAFSSLSRRAKL